MTPEVKAFLNTRPRLVPLSHLHQITGGPSNQGGDYERAQRWLAMNGYIFSALAEGWVYGRG